MWWHGVLNLDDTVAITQNYCNLWNFDKVFNVFCGETPLIFEQFISLLMERKPDLYQRALDLKQRRAFEDKLNP